MFSKLFLFSALASSSFGVTLGNSGFQSGPTDNASNPAVPWTAVEASADVNPIYLWSSGGGMPVGGKTAVFKDGNGTSMPDYLSQNLDNITADALANVTVSMNAGWRNAVANDAATFRVVLWNVSEGSALSAAEFSFTRAAALLDTYTVDGGSPFSVSLPYDRTAPNLAGDSVSLRIGRVDADGDFGNNNWKSSAWIDDVGVSATVTPTPVSPAVVELLERKVPALADAIVFESLPDSAGDAFRLGNADGKVVIAGTNTNARAAGLHWYLKRHCGMHFSWSGDQTAVPSSLPMPDEPIRTSPWKWRSAHNHCVFSYTMAFWDWPRWEKEIDFLALNGVNQAFLLTGHEKVWQNTLRRLGFSDAQIATWLPSTSHISWWHYDNLQGEGGPLTQQEIDREAVLARQVADRMRALGIEPVTLGFYGMVPNFFATQFPTANLIAQGTWAGGYARPPMLDPSDPAFATAAAIYYEEMQTILGPVKHHCGDPFHEGGNSGSLNLATAFKKVQDAMLAATPEAVWVMFGWTGNPKAAGLVNLDPAHVMVQRTSLNLGTAMPVSGNYNPYSTNSGPIPWTWQIIDNFGGNHGLYGNFDTTATLPSRFLNGGVSGNFVGLGHSPEAIETNPLQATLYYDMFWRDENVDVSTWLDETVTARYGAANAPARAAWDLLARSSYRCPIGQEGISDSIFGTRPKVGANRARTWAKNDPYWCELDIVEAWKLLLDAAPTLSGNANFRHDLVDVTRHALNFHSKRVYDAMMAAFSNRDQAAFDAQAEELLRLFDELDTVLATDPGLLLGTWLEQAKAKGHDAASRERIERNARNQITLWSGKHDALDDYASRSWAGLVGTHYKARWARYIADLRGGWAGWGTPAYSGIDLELAFLDDRTTFSTTPAGKVETLTAAIYQRLSPALRQRASLRWSVPQEESGEVVLRFDVTERLKAGQSHRVALLRQYGDAAVTLKRIALAGSAVIEEHIVNATLSATVEARDFAPVTPGQQVFLEITIQGNGSHSVANGPVEFSTIFNASRTDYIGRFQYAANGSTYYRELRKDGTVGLFVDGSSTDEWSGFTWQFIDGEAHLFKANGILFERHRLTDPGTLLFQVEQQYGPGLRIPLISFYRSWAIGLGLTAMANDPDGDADGDDIDNLGEFLFGTDPELPGPAITIQPAGAGLLLVQWKRRADALLEAIDYSLQQSTDLAAWSLRPGPETTAISSLPGYLDVKIEIAATAPSTFFRAAAIDH